MPRQVSDFLIERLYDWGVRRIFGYPGDGINGVLGALDRFEHEQSPDAIRFVQSRHEEMAAFMATAHAKFSGEVGVCLATQGPGAIHLLNGLYDAKMDHQPVVAIIGQQSRSALGSSYQQEVDLQNLFKDVASEYIEMITTPTQARHVIDRAMRIAKAKRTVTCVIIPSDVQALAAVDELPREHTMSFSGIGYVSPHVVPIAEELQRAADILNSGERVAILAGAGALDATDELIAVANMLGAGVAKALLGKAAVPDDLPFVTGSIGLLGTKPSWDMMNQCDTLLMIGSGFPYAEFLPPEGQARGVQIDLEPSMLSLRYPMEVNLVGDSRQTLRALLPLLHRKSDRSWQEKISREVADWWKVLERRAMSDATPVNPQRVFWDLSAQLPQDAMIACDTGTATFYYARDVRLKRGMQGTLSGGLASMGNAVPYAIAAKFANPDRPAIALVGDGAMQMNGNAELLTVAKYWQEWADPRFIVLVLNNGDLNFVTWEMRVMAGDPKFEASQDLPDFPYAQYAASLGFKGLHVDDPGDMGMAWSEAFHADRPTLIEVMVDANIPPLPPHIKLEQARSMTTALLKGDRDALAVIRKSFMEMAKGL